MNVLLIFNDSYAVHAATVITGLLSKCSERLSIYVFYSSLSEGTIKTLKDYYVDKLDVFQFIKIEIPNNMYKFIERIESRKKGYLKNQLEVYLRLFAPLYLDVDDVLYLDCDIVINGDVSEIRKDVDESKLLCAVKEHDPNHKLRPSSDLEKEQMPPSLYEYIMRDSFFTRMKKYHKMHMTAPYFCAGVLYLNLALMRKCGFYDKVEEKMQYESNFVFADQDILNSIINGDFGVLPPKWNSFVAGQGILINYSTKELIEARVNPIIVHMPGLIKPWYKKETGKFQKQYWEYRKNTPWPEKYSYPKYRSLLDLFVKIYNKFFRIIINISNRLIIEKKRPDEGVDMQNAYME